MAAGFLMYHELEEPGRPLVDADPGYTTYVLDKAAFARQLAWMASAGLRGVSVGEWRSRGLDATGNVVITFDDGCETDWTMAAPRLLEQGFGATFYVVSGWIGRAGFLSAAQLRELADAGFEVGSHSLTHAFLTDIDRAQLGAELGDSKHQLEDLLGRPVRQFSCPGGRWNRDVETVARELGYETVATSRVGANTRTTNPYALSRCAIQRHTSQRTVEAFSRGEGLTTMRVRERALAAAKAVLGNRAYDTLRGAALRKA